MSDDDVDLDQLAKVSTATATHLLFKLGIRNTFLEGIKPLWPDSKAVGRARTLRYLPVREDLAPNPYEPSGNAQRRAIESIKEGEILVIDAGGELGSGTLGDILSARMKYLGGAGLIVDGAVRDAVQIRDVGLQVWARGVHGAANMRMLWPVDVDIPVRCGGCTVIPGDYILADSDGAVTIPATHAAGIAEEGAETELRESFIRAKISIDGYSTDRAYPPNAEVLAEFEAWKKTQG